MKSRSRSRKERSRCSACLCCRVRAGLDLEQPPFPLALDDPGSVLAVKGTLRRFAPWTAAGRSEGMTLYEGKGGMQISQ